MFIWRATALIRTALPLCAQATNTTPNKPVRSQSVRSSGGDGRTGGTGGRAGVRDDGVHPDCVSSPADHIHTRTHTHTLTEAAEAAEAAGESVSERVRITPVAHHQQHNTHACTQHCATCTTPTHTNTHSHTCVAQSVRLSSTTSRIYAKPSVHIYCENTHTYTHTHAHK